jgi:hypothetical protein
MTPDVRSSDLQELLAGHRVWYEFRPYYAVVDQRPPGGPPVQHKVQAGFDVNLYAVLETEQHFGLDRTQKARVVRTYFQAVAWEIQSQAGQGVTVEVMPYEDSIILDTHEHFQPEVMLQVRIGHCRGLDQPSGASEEQALEALRDRLRDLGITQK